MGEQFRVVVVHAGDAEVPFAPERLANIVNAVRVVFHEPDDGEHGVPAIFNTDPGCRFSPPAFASRGASG